MLGVGTTFDSPLIQYLAREAARRCTGRGSFDAIAAVIMSYSAFEGFLNELAQLIETTLYEAEHQEERVREPHPEPLITQLRPLAWAMRVAISYRARSEDRFDLAWEAFAGTAVDKGRGFRQQLSVLAKLRNDLVHMKAEQTPIVLTPTTPPTGFDGQWMGLVEMEYDTPRYFDSLRAWGLLPDDYPKQRWVNRICNAEIAEWACSTVEQAAEALVLQMPEGTAFRKRLEDQSLRKRIPAS